MSEIFNYINIQHFINKIPHNIAYYSLKLEIMSIFKSNIFIKKLGFISILFLFIGCQFSETYSDPSAGFNGSFEVSKKGIPVNWLMYTPNTVSNSNFTIVLDNEIYKHGKQSLKFDVKECSSVGGNMSPGFTKQFTASSGSTYKLSFWAKNNGSEFIVSAGGVSPKTGDMETLIKSDKEMSEWEFFEFDVPIPSEHNSIRIQLNIIKPGVFWIDDVQLEEL